MSKEPVNHLHDGHYTMPGVFYQTMTKKQLSDTLLATDGKVMATGHLRSIKSKHLGAGIYEVRLEALK